MYNPRVSNCSPDRAAMATALRDLLVAAGLDVERADLQGTPERVARLWTESFLGGYSADPAQILGDPVEGEAETDLVVVREIPCHGLCPHHLLPWTGSATVAYMPRAKLVGFGRLADLVHCYTRRPTLQERAANDISESLITHLGARGSACVITATHNCLSVPDDKHETRVVTVSYRGELRERSDLQAQLYR